MHIPLIVPLRLVVVAVIVLAQAGTAADSSSPSAQSRIVETPDVRDARTRLEIWLEGQRMKHDLPGFSVGVVHDQELIWSNIRRSGALSAIALRRAGSREGGHSSAQ